MEWKGFMEVKGSSWNHRWQVNNQYVFMSVSLTQCLDLWSSWVQRVHLPSMQLLGVNTVQSCTLCKAVIPVTGLVPYFLSACASSSNNWWCLAENCTRVSCPSLKLFCAYEIAHKFMFRENTSNARHWNPYTIWRYIKWLGSRNQVVGGWLN